MSNQCNKCGSRNTATVKAKEMADKTGDKNFVSGTAACVGQIDPVVVIKVLWMMFGFLGQLFSWLEEKNKNERNIVICKDCGYWERV